MTTNAQPGRRSDKKRGKYAVAIDPDVIARVDQLVNSGLFRSRSHGVEEGIKLLLIYHRDKFPSAEDGKAA